MIVLEMTASNTTPISSFAIEMNKQRIRELRAIVRKRDLCRYYKLKKAELLSLLKTPIRAPNEC